MPEMFQTFPDVGVLPEAFPISTELPGMFEATAGPLQTYATSTGFDYEQPLPTRGDAPSALQPQPRSYVTPSSTARKAVPRAFIAVIKKRQLEESLAPDEIPADIVAQIEHKRRVDALAMRRRRAKKAEAAQQSAARIHDLEAEVAHLRGQLLTITADRDYYKAQLDILVML